MWTRELHGAVTHASQDQIICKLECAAGQGGGGHRSQIRNYDSRIRKTKTGRSVRLPARDSSGSLSGVNPKFISFCAETAHATASGAQTAVAAATPLQHAVTKLRNGRCCARDAIFLNFCYSFIVRMFASPMRLHFLSLSCVPLCALSLKAASAQDLDPRDV